MQGSFRDFQLALPSRTHRVGSDDYKLSPGKTKKNLKEIFEKKLMNLQPQKRIIDIGKLGFDINDPNKVSVPVQMTFDLDEVQRTIVDSYHIDQLNFGTISERDEISFSPDHKSPIMKRDDGQ
jgi:hypothetical protein